LELFMAFHTTRRIEFADTDMAGIVHFANFFRFMEAAEVEFLRSRGLSVSMAWDGEQIGFPRVSASCDYRKPAYFEDLLEITVRIARLGRKSVTYAFEFSKDGDLIAEGQVSSVCCRVGTGHALASIEIPEKYRQMLEAMAD
jgi:YbgC/YbaW family acyl-CoA thioester hydrolase